MKRKFLITALLLCCFAICYAVITDMSGQWSSTFNAPDGNAYPLTYTFKVDGNKLTGTLETSLSHWVSLDFFNSVSAALHWL